MRKKKNTGLREIAERTGFNIGTVSRALTGRAGISRENARRILDLAYEMGYCNSAEKRVAVILPPIRNAMQWYTLALLNAICQEAAERSVCLELIFADQADRMLERSVSGILSLDYQNFSLHKLCEIKPFVTINNFSNIPEDMYSVSSDMKNGIFQAVRLLYSYGHRKIGLYISGGRTQNSLELEKAFRQELLARSMDGEAVWGILEEKVRFYAFGSIMSLLEKKVTAIIANGESVSSEILAGIRLCGKRVPEDVSLITWEVPLFSKFQAPPLTTVSQDFPRLAATAFDLLDRIAARENPPFVHTVDCMLIERNSVSVPRKT